MAGQAIAMEEGSPAHRMWVLNQFQQYVYAEMVPAIRQDCGDPDIGVVAAGASIGAFNALAVLCRFPDVFTHAIGMSGTYDIHRFIGGPITDDFYYSSPVHWLPDCPEDRLAQLRTRFALLVSGEGRAEDIGESWRLAGLLGKRGIPNRVDSWGPEWHHDWPTWRRMLPQYLDELLP